jgi:hypothetical protein
MALIADLSDWTNASAAADKVMMANANFVFIGVS